MFIGASPLPTFGTLQQHAPGGPEVPRASSYPGPISEGLLAFSFGYGFVFWGLLGVRNYNYMFMPQPMIGTH